MTQPNILYIHSHDTGRYVQPYGYAVPTPRIQRLAEEGVVFRQAFCAAPGCSASRASFVTGQCPHSNGMLGLAHLGWRLNDYKKHLLHTLRDAGYYTALAGFQHVAHWNHIDDVGYDEYHADGAAPRAAEVVPAALDFLRNAPKQPFFLSVGVAETHRFFGNTFVSASGPIGDPRYVRPPATIPDTPETRRDMGDYVEGARVLDDAVGAVLDELEKQGLDENTLVINTTDHGLPFPGMKSTVTDHGTGVLLIMRGPGGFEGGKVIDGMVSQIDVFPTVCDLVGITPPDWLEGRSMMPLVRGEAEEINDEVFAELTYHGSYEPKRSVRTKRWRYIRHYGGEALPGDNIDGSISRDLWLEHGWRDHVSPPERLYDLVFDPNEACNVADDPRNAAVLKDLRGRLDRWMERTDDPLLRGAVEPAAVQKRFDDARREGRPFTADMFEQ